MAVVPYKEREEGKKEQVADMFDAISPKYDLLNRILSGGTDVRWRRKAIKQLRDLKPDSLLDIATGTGDVALEAHKQLKPAKVVGVDISEGMMAEGRKKLERLGLSEAITLQYGDSENLPFDESSFQAITVAFGVRNFENLEKGLSDMLRVLKPGGKAVILEFSQPTAVPMKQLYWFYSRTILPTLGRLISKDKSAYTYLPDSVAAFPYGENFLRIMDKVGYIRTVCKPLTFGIASIYVGEKAS